MSHGTGLVPRIDGDERRAASEHVTESPEGVEHDREMLLELLAQQQRVAQVGLITSGLTHDIANHLQVISGRVYLALQHDDPHEWREALEKVQELCAAMTETTRAFLGFVRRRKTTWQESFQLSSVIEEGFRLTRRLAEQECVSLETASDGAALVRGEPGLAVQAIVNLVSNAIKACAPSHGQVSIRASCPSDTVARIEVSDNGPGIPEDVRRRLFRPFATSRGDGGGNGLGLFIVRQAVRKLGGQIKMTTSSEGTTFWLDLPRATPCPESAAREN
jgi:two-component system C4-dicarboxylate transport sensor histidine kinase DctB